MRSSAWLAMGTLLATCLVLSQCMHPHSRELDLHPHRGRLKRRGKRGRRHPAARGAATTARKPLYGSAKCIGQTFSILDHRTKSCLYRNLCYDTDKRRFKLFVEPSQRAMYKHHTTRAGDWTMKGTGEEASEMPPANTHDNAQYWSRKTMTNNTIGTPRGHMVADLTVSLSAANKAWSQIEWHMNYTLTEFDKVDPDVIPWAPDIADGPIPVEAVFDKSSPLFMLYMGIHSANIGHLMFDEFLPWYTIMRMFNIDTTGTTGSKHEGTSSIASRVQPLNWNFIAPNAPDQRPSNTVFWHKHVYDKGHGQTEECSQYFFRHIEKNKHKPDPLAPPWDGLPDKCDPNEWGTWRYSKNVWDLSNIIVNKFLPLMIDTRPLPNTTGSGSASASTSSVWPSFRGSRSPTPTSLLPLRRMRIFPDFNGEVGGEPAPKGWHEKRRAEAQAAHTPMPGPEAGGEGKAPRLVCYSKLMAGIGYLAEHCDDWSFHGVKDGHESYDHHAFCNAGKGPLFFDFRNFMIESIRRQRMFEAAGAHVPVEPCRRNKGAKAQLLFNVREGVDAASGGFADVKTSAEGTKSWLKLAKMAEERLGVTSKLAVLSKLPLAEQVALHMESIAAVQLPGGSSSTGLFLPVGGTMLLVADKEIKDDWIMWGHFSHIKVQWFEIESHESVLDVDKLLPILAHAVKHYHEFNNCYDSAVDEPPPHLHKVLSRLP